MNANLKHSIILIASIILLGATLFVPMPARNSEEMERIWFGYPLQFISQDLSAYDTVHVFPRYQQIEVQSYQNFNGFSVTGLVSSILVIFLSLEGIIFLLEQIKKRFF